MLNSVRNVKFIIMQELTNVHHHCLCFIFDQTTIAQEQKSLRYIYPFEARLFWFMVYRTRNITFGTRLFWFMLIDRGIFLFAV